MRSRASITRGSERNAYRGASIQIEAMARATSVAELFARLEAEGIMLRVDPDVAPTMFRGAVVTRRITW
jgi:hypothetical protein